MLESRSCGKTRDILVLQYGPLCRPRNGNCAEHYRVAKSGPIDLDAAGVYFPVKRLIYEPDMKSINLDYNKEVEHSLLLVQPLDNYYKWHLEVMVPYLGSRILEIGAGLGSYSDDLKKERFLVVSDYDRRYVDILKKKYDGDSSVEVCYLDLNNIGVCEKKYFRELGIDSIMATNVMEHIENDVECIKNLIECLGPKGRIILINPSHKILYSRFDAVVGHYRRYTRQDCSRINRAGVGTFKVVVCRNFNLFGALGWFWSHRVCKRKHLSSTMIKTFDFLAPALKKIDWLGAGRIGIHQLMVIEKI